MTAEQIRAYRESKGLTQSQFASMLRVSPTAVTQWEKGQAPSGPASLLLEHLIQGAPLFSSSGDADWDMPLTLKEWEELERRRVRTGFISVRDYMVWLVRREMQQALPPAELLPETPLKRHRSPKARAAPSETERQRQLDREHGHENGHGHGHPNESALATTGPATGLP